MNLSRIIVCILVGVAFAAPIEVGAQESHHHGHHAAAPSHAGQTGGRMAQTAKTPEGKALYEVSKKMHHAMDVALVGTPDADFVRTMIPHHQGAIDMAHVVLKHGHDQGVRRLAGNIARTQNWEIAWMKRLLARMDQPLDVTVGNGAMEKSADTSADRELLAIHHKMHQAMDVRLTGDADADFVRAMIPHHQGAIDMAYWVLDHGRNSDVQELARDIIQAQRAEIAWMRHWLRNKEGVVPCGCPQHRK